MAELGETGNPADLVPGNPAVLHETALAMTTYADVLDEAGNGLDRVATPAGWSGATAEQYRTTFAVQPARWLDAGGAHREAARAVEAHAVTLEWAQRQAAEAVRLWDEGRPGAPPLPNPADTLVDPGLDARERAIRLLGDARAQLAVAGDRAAAVVGAARDRAPADPDLGERIVDGVREGAAAVGNATASLGNAALHHPLDIAGVLGGAGLVAVGTAGAVGSVALDATGVGALGGVPLGGASVAGIATGAGLVGAGAIDLALNAVGPDRVAPFQVNEESASPAQRIPSVGEPGKSKRVREVPDDQTVRDLWSELSEDGEPFSRGGYEGRWVTTPDGTEIGFREGSLTGGPTIDARLPDGKIWKIHRGEP